MSVINQMLLDLERRRASGDERNRIPDHVRALPGENTGTNHRRVSVIIGAAVALAALLAVAGWLWFSPAAFLQSAPAPVSPAPVANAPALAVATAPPAAAPEAPPQSASAPDAGSRPQAPSQAESLPQAESKPQTKPLPQAQAPAQPEAAHIAMRMSFELSKIPDQDAAPRSSSGVSLKSVVARAPAVPATSAADTAPRTRPAVEPQRAAKPVVEKAAPDAKPAVSASTKAAAPASGNAGINKQVREGTPRQRADAEYARGVAALHQGHGSEARAAFEAALQIDPAHHVARQALTGALLEVREFGAAMNLLQEGLELAPAQPGFAMMLARLQVERGQLDAGVRTLARSAEFAEGNADYAAFFAGLLQRQQKHAEAVTQFQRALQLRPNAGVWLLGLGLSLEALGRSADALEAFRRAGSSGNLPPDLQTYAEQRAR